MKRLNLFNTWKIWTVVLLSGAIIGCSEDDGGGDPTPTSDEPVASFQAQVDENDFATFNFTNFSQNATSYEWDFGDDEGTSDQESPSYTYSETGDYTVTLVASNDDGDSDDFSLSISVTDPLESQRALFGEDGKVWYLLADASTGVNTFEVGPADRSAVWWALGGVTDLCTRECLFNDTWTFNPDGSYTFDNAGDFWAEGGIWGNGLNEECFDANDAANFVNVDGTDISDWDSGTHSFEYDPSANTLVVTGGFIGLTKVASTEEVTVPQASVTYSVAKLVDVEDGVDTLVVETVLEEAGGYWAFTLVSYDDEADVVEVDECEVVVSPTIEDVNIDFESDAPTWTPFGGPASDGVGVTPSTVANPVSGGINTSAMVGQLDEADGSQGWSGISTVLDGKIDFTNKQTFKVKVYSPVAGAVIKFKLEDSGDPNNNKEIDMTTTAADTWEELSYTFDATEDSGKWDVLVLFFDFLDVPKTGARTHYFDDIVLE